MINLSLKTHRLQELQHLMLKQNPAVSVSRLLPNLHICCVNKHMHNQVNGSIKSFRSWKKWQQLAFLSMCSCSMLRCTCVYRHYMPVVPPLHLSANCSRQVWLSILFFMPYSLSYTDRQIHVLHLIYKYMHTNMNLHFCCRGHYFNTIYIHLSTHIFIA